ncbi:MAG: hypothetical protein AABX60_03225 [Nanoarchaeota archaeon]
MSKSELGGCGVEGYYMMRRRKRQKSLCKISVLAEKLSEKRHFVGKIAAIAVKVSTLP